MKMRPSRVPKSISTDQRHPSHMLPYPDNPKSTPVHMKASWTSPGERDCHTHRSTGTTLSKSTIPSCCKVQIHFLFIFIFLELFAASNIISLFLRILPWLRSLPLFLSSLISSPLMLPRFLSLSLLPSYTPLMGWSMFHIHDFKVRTPNSISQPRDPQTRWGSLGHSNPHFQSWIHPLSSSKICYSAPKPEGILESPLHRSPPLPPDSRSACGFVSNSTDTVIPAATLPNPEDGGRLTGLPTAPQGLLEIHFPLVSRKKLPKTQIPRDHTASQSHAFAPHSCFTWHLGLPHPTPPPQPDPKAGTASPQHYTCLADSLRLASKRLQTAAPSARQPHLPLSAAPFPHHSDQP